MPALFVLLFVLLTVSSFAQPISKADSTALSPILNEFQATPLNEYQLFRAPTKPQPIRRCQGESDATDYLVVAIPGPELRSEKHRTFYGRLIAAAIRATDVVILTEENNPDNYEAILSLLEERSLSQFLGTGTRNRIHIAESKINTKWIRDYGPFFARNTRNELCVLDAVYDDLLLTSRKQNNTPRDSLAFLKSGSIRYKDDLCPMYLAEFLQSIDPAAKIRIVRPPIQLWGGDVQVGKGQVLFTSTNTLLMNGGNREYTDLIFRTYYGAKKIVYLQPLPGPVIKHIDLFFKVANDSTILLGKYYDYGQSAGLAYHRHLIREANKVLDQDSVILAQNLGKSFRIFRFPMPPLEIRSKKDILAEEVKKLDSAITALRLEYDVARISDSIHGSTLVAEKGTKGGQSQAGQSGNIHLQTRSGSILKTINSYVVLRDEFALSIKQMERDGITPSEYQYLYKTYLNFTCINGKTGKLLLVPRYSSNRNMEEEIRRILSLYYKDYEIQFINCDDIIQEGGAIHCSTIVVPGR